MKDWARAPRALLLKLLDKGYGENAIVEWYLAQVAEDTGRYQIAFERYQAVPEGERGWIARAAAASRWSWARWAVCRGAQVPHLKAVNAMSIEQKIQVR